MSEREGGGGGEARGRVRQGGDREGGREGGETDRERVGVRACVKMAKSESVMLIGGVKS